MSNVTRQLIPWGELSLYDDGRQWCEHQQAWVYPEDAGPRQDEVDSDGCPPADADHLRALAQEFRDHGTISGFWFVNPTGTVAGAESSPPPDPARGDLGEHDETKNVRALRTNVRPARGSGRRLLRAPLRERGEAAAAARPPERIKMSTETKHTLDIILDTFYHTTVDRGQYSRNAFASAVQYLHDLRAQRDALLAACEKLMARSPECAAIGFPHDTETCSTCFARAAIELAKVGA